MSGSVESTVGIELELSLINSKGFLANRAPFLLEDPRNDGSIVYETSNAMVEVISAPHPTTRRLHHDFLTQLNLLEDICTDYGVSAVPVSCLGAGIGTQKWNPRLGLYPNIMGQSYHQLRSVNGLHAHFSQFPGRQLGQFWLFTALDPISFALTSTSPMSNRGVMQVNCHRIKLIRETLSTQVPLHGQLLEYPKNLLELEKRGFARFEQWSKRSGLTMDAFEKLFKPGDTGFAPIRKRDQIGPVGTLEVRGFDACPLEYIMGAVALFKGCNDRIIREQIPITIARRDRQCYFGPDRIILPNYTSLKELEYEAMSYGLRSDKVARYLNILTNFAMCGLGKEDRPYLSTLNEMLQSRQNPADRVVSYLRRHGIRRKELTPQESASANLFMREMYLGSLSFLRDQDLEPGKIAANA